MKRGQVGAGTIALGLLLGAQTAAPQQTGSQPGVRGVQADLAAVVLQLAVELRAVRLELQILQIDYSARLLAGLEQEAQWLQAQRRKMESREASVRDSVASVVELLKQPALSQAEREELVEIQESRDLRPDSELTRILAEKDRLARREVEVAQQIQNERKKWEQARVTAEGLQNELSRMQRPGTAASN